MVGQEPMETEQPKDHEVVIRHMVVEPSLRGPRSGGESSFRREVDGKLVDEEVLPKHEVEGT